MPQQMPPTDSDNITTVRKRASPAPTAEFLARKAVAGLDMVIANLSRSIDIEVTAVDRLSHTTNRLVDSVDNLAENIDTNKKDISENTVALNDLNSTLETTSDDLGDSMDDLGDSVDDLSDIIKALKFSNLEDSKTVSSDMKDEIGFDKNDDIFDVVVKNNLILTEMNETSSELLLLVEKIADSIKEPPENPGGGDHQEVDEEHKGNNTQKRNIVFRDNSASLLPFLDEFMERFKSVGVIPVVLGLAEILSVISDIRKLEPKWLQDAFGRVKDVTFDLGKFIVDWIGGPIVRTIMDLVDTFKRIIKGDYIGAAASASLAAAPWVGSLAGPEGYAAGAVIQKGGGIAADAINAGRDASQNGDHGPNDNPLSNPNYFKSHGGFLTGLKEWMGIDTAGTIPTSATDLIKKKEAFRSNFYDDRGHTAIGYGHNVTDKEWQTGYLTGTGSNRYSLEEMKQKGLSETQASDVLHHDMSKTIEALRDGIGRSMWDRLPEAWKTALTSRAFNAGTGSVLGRADVKSTYKLRDALREGNLQEAASVLNDGTFQSSKMGGHEPVLERRRQEEYNMVQGHMQLLPAQNQKQSPEPSAIKTSTAKSGLSTLASNQKVSGIMINNQPVIINNNNNVNNGGKGGGKVVNLPPSAPGQYPPI